MDRYDWSQLNHLQIGRYAEYFTKMEFVLHIQFSPQLVKVSNRGINQQKRFPSSKQNQQQN